MKMNQQIFALRGKCIGKICCSIVTWEIWGNEGIIFVSDNFLG